ncbi:MAG: chemotaxis protein CheW [Desulfatibacillaceae bacterium]
MTTTETASNNSKPAEQAQASEARGATTQFVCFVVDNKQYALPLDRVERVVRMVRITPVPATPAYVEGMIDLQGRVIPVVNLRRRFGFDAIPPGLDDRIIVANSSERSIAVMVDEVTELLEVPVRQVEPPPPAPRAKARPVGAVIRRNEELIMVVDTDRLIPSARHIKALLKGESQE